MENVSNFVEMAQASSAALTQLLITYPITWPVSYLLWSTTLNTTSETHRILPTR